MKKCVLLLTSWILVASLCSGCLYANVRAPLDKDVDSTRLGTKVGKSSATAYLYLVSTGDASTEAAARDGGITTITHLDFEVQSILFGLYLKTTTIAYGD